MKTKKPALQPLELDFVRRRQGSPWAGRLLLALAVGFAGDAGLSFLKARNSVIEAQARLDRASGQYRPARRVAPEELAAARDTVQRLALPWDELFSALEEAATGDVALLAIEPDPKSGTVVITGDSKDYLAALTYVLNLSRTEGLSRVQLVRHEAKQNAVGFSVSAKWRNG